ncbi:metallophosphoesterase family protein [Pseudomonas knackmussii]|uniref:metallophosphoesterase family protein n=1 Tax=Pseudomonas knackmussii TaxID=65741 RepID=UPI003F4A37F3
MRLHILSDLHNEFRPYTPAEVNADVVILAGDIDVQGRALAWAEASFQCPVLYVPGNHEYYKGHLVRSMVKMRQTSCSHVHVLDLDEIVIDNVRFLGATQWTDFCSTGNSPLATSEAQAQMSDYRHIRVENFRKLRPADVVNRAVQAKHWLRERLDQPFNGKTVVITHHAPILRSLQGNPIADTALAASYANAWDELLMSTDIWVHGHIHTAQDYYWQGARVICNPRGYPGQQTGFNPELAIEL